MLAKILGVIWILLGILWFFKPEALQNRLKKKMNRKMKWIIFGFVVMFGFIMIGSVFKTSGILPKVIGIIGMILVIKGIILITSKTSDKIFGWLEDRPLKIFRIWALAFIAIGLSMLFVR
ncbi:MAG: hypothetical protein PVH45_05075 [Candidatus Omnitrophota bacterium]|jgi:hypothetical protein